jgi:hypothetical protein
MAARVAERMAAGMAGTHAVRMAGTFAVGMLHMAWAATRRVAASSLAGICRRLGGDGPLNITVGGREARQGRGLARGGSGNGRGIARPGVAAGARRRQGAESDSRREPCGRGFAAARQGHDYLDISWEMPSIMVILAAKEPIMPSAATLLEFVAACVVVAGLALMPSMPRAAHGETLAQFQKTNTDKNIVVKGKRIKFYGLDVAFKKSRDPMTPWVVDAVYKGKQILQSAQTTDTFSQTEIAVDFPKPGMSTLVLKLFDGGASCCWTHEVFTYDGASIGYANVAIGWGGSFSPFGENGLLETVDHSLNGYSDVAPNDVVINYYPGSHPAPIRYGVFANGGWRPDKPGEFPKRYEELEAAAKKATADARSNEQKHLEAASAAYYCLMAGKAKAQCLGDLKANLPQGFQPLAAALLDAIDSSVQKFSFH